MSLLSLIGNILWFISGGIFGAIAWVVSGILCYITIIGIPFGKQCFKLAKLQLAPFGKKVINRGSTPMGLIGNIIWIIFPGLELAIFNLVAALFMAVTIIGIPFAVQGLKMAKLSFMPFGKDVLTEDQIKYKM
ncbi:MAG: YccF domain-containing protein [bacterium]